MANRKSFLAFAAMGLIATAAFSYQAVAQNAEQEGEQGNGQAGMMMQCPMMEALKSVQLHADSPAVLLGREESLNLSAEQRDQLKEIAATARQQARDLLSEEQRQQLEEAPSGPLSPMQLAHLQRKKGAGEGKGKMCPMCTKMMERTKQREGGEPDNPNGQQ